MYAAHECDDDASHPGSWGTDPALLRYRTAPAPRHAQGAVRGFLPRFGDGPNSSFPMASPEQKNSPETEKKPYPANSQNAASQTFALHADPSSKSTETCTDKSNPSMVSLPPHTQRLVVAQQMLRRQRLINDATLLLIARRRVFLSRGLAERRKQDAERELAAQAERLAGETVDDTARKGLCLTGVDATQKKTTRAQLREAARVSAFATAVLDEHGYVDLRPAPALPAIPVLRSLQNPDVPDEQHVYAVANGKFKKGIPTKASAVRSAVLAAAAAAGDVTIAGWRLRYQCDTSDTLARSVENGTRAFSERFDRDEDTDGNGDGDEEYNTTENNYIPYAAESLRPKYVRYRRRPSHSRWDGMADMGDFGTGDDPRVVRARERARLQKALEVHASRLEKDAAESAARGKFVKAEHALRQLVNLRGASLDRGHTSALEVRPAGAGDDSVIKFDSNADESYKSVAEYGASPSIETGRDPPEAAFALAKLAQAMLCGHEKDTSSRGGSTGSASRLASAIDHLKRALEIRKRVCGAKHGDTLRVMNELATAHKRVGDFPRATRLDLERRRLGKRGEE